MCPLDWRLGFDCSGCFRVRWAVVSATYELAVAASVVVGVDVFEGGERDFA